MPHTSTQLTYSLQCLQGALCHLPVHSSLTAYSVYRRPYVTYQYIAHLQLVVFIGGLMSIPVDSSPTACSVYRGPYVTYQYIAHPQLAVFIGNLLSLTSKQLTQLTSTQLNDSLQCLQGALFDLPVHSSPTVFIIYWWYCANQQCKAYLQPSGHIKILI